ncbi:MAG: Maf-like protein [Pseudomonadota bacterium]
MSATQKLVLASGSPRRLQLLQQVGIDPDFLSPVNADESPNRGEVPRSLAKRLAKEKAALAVENVKRSEEMQGSYILAADTVVGLGRRILPKAEILEDAEQCLRLLSGRNHRVYTGLTLVTPQGSARHRLVESRVRFKRLSKEELTAYLASGDWRGKAGGYAIQGIAGSFVVKLIGSYSNVVGLPLYETISLLNGEGFQAHLNWVTTS